MVRKSSGQGLERPTSAGAAFSGAWVVVVGAMIWAATSLGGAEPPVRCPATPLEDRLPEVIAAMAGEDPIWLVDGSFGKWRGSEELVKSMWVLSRAEAGDLLVTGRRLKGPGSVLFQIDPSGSPSKRLELPGLEGREVIPGGATPEIMSRYAFVPMHIIYPSPGCWQITVELGGEERRIVVEQGEGTASPSR